MLRIYLRIYGFIILAVVASVLFQLYVAETFLKQVGTGNTRERHRATYHLIEEAVLPLPPEQRLPRFEALKQGFGNPAGMVPLDQLAPKLGLEDFHRDLLRRDRILAFEREEGGSILVKLLRGTDTAVTLEFPGPSSNRFIGFAINLGIEFLFLGLLMWFWVRPFWRDLTAVDNAAQAVADGDLQRRIVLDSRSPLAKIAGTFNTMLDRINALLNSHRSLMNAVSHEFKTPIATLRFRHEMARDETELAAKDRQLMLMERSIDQLDDLAAELLTYARLERDEPNPIFERFAAEPMVEDVLLEAREWAAARGRAVTIAADVSVDELEGDQRYLRRALSNLLGNAVQHAAAQVSIAIRAAGGGYEVTVDDDGPGIPPAQREAVFEPFVRLDSSRDRASGGVGMGLAIVHQIARWHRGSAKADAAPGGGARLVLAWPRLMP